MSEELCESCPGRPLDAAWCPLAAPPCKHPAAAGNGLYPARATGPTGEELRARGFTVLDEWGYVTLDRLQADALTLRDRLPPELDTVIGISRSGLLPASTLAHHLHLPLLTVSRQRGLTDPGHGFRLDGRPPREPRAVLLIDDTASSGREMKACEAIVRAALPGASITRAVVYCHPKGLRAVDLFVAVLPGWHFLEWNWCNAGHGEACGYDFDGILCPDFTREQCRDMETYRAAMEAMPPRFLPRRTAVPLIATGRPESCRDITEAWLARWGVRCDRLVMWPGDPHPRAAEVAAWKADLYRSSRCKLFAESEPRQARIIHRRTGRPVLCPSLGRVLPPLLSLVTSCEDRVPAGCACAGRWACKRRDGAEVEMATCLECVAGEAGGIPVVRKNLQY